MCVFRCNPQTIMHAHTLHTTAGKHGNFVVSKCIDKEFGCVSRAPSLPARQHRVPHTALPSSPTPLPFKQPQRTSSSVAHPPPPPHDRYGFNAQTLTYCNLLEAGVLDAATVTENSLQNSVSIASLVLTSGVSCWVLFCWVGGWVVFVVFLGRMDGRFERVVAATAWIDFEDRGPDLLLDPSSHPPNTPLRPQPTNHRAWWWRTRRR
jgi:hypothetical protein